MYHKKKKVNNSDERAQKLESDVQQISSGQISEDITLEEPISKLEAHHSQVQSRESLLLQTFSGGQALQGQPPKHSIVDFAKFNEFLRDAMGNMHKESKEEQVVASENVTMAIQQLRSHYHNTYDELLIKILVLPLQKNCLDDIITLIPLSLCDLYDIQIRFYEEIENFKTHKRKGYMQLQLFLLLLAADQSRFEEGQIMKTLLEISETMKKLNPPLEETISKQLNQYLIKDSPLKELIQNLETMKASAILQPASPKNPAALLKILDLGKYYVPKNLQLQDALCIRAEPIRLSLGKSQPTDPKQLPTLMLHKLMSYDCTCMSDLLAKDYKDYESDDYCGSDDENDTVDSKFSNDRDNGLHPVDCLLALLICSDNFLCQDLFSRLAKCQFAVPLLLPDPFTKQFIFPIWCLHSIIKEWKTTREDKVVQQVCSIVNYPMPIVSFIRFGQHEKRKHGASSKSKLLNEIISNSHHDHFFHRDCPGGQYNRILGEGFVDMCWYLPVGKASDAFPDAVAFLNLHGDARKHPHQLRFLSQISSICLVLLNEENLEFKNETMKSLEMFNSSPGGIIILNDVEQRPKTLKKEFPDAYVVQLTSKTGSEIKDKICRQIKRKLDNLTDLKTIEELYIVKDTYDIIADEDSVLYKEGLDHAKKITSMITNHKAKEVSMKEAMLPLQGESMWKAWAHKSKELHRQIEKGEKTITEYTAEIEEEKKKIRAKQLEHVKSLTPVTKLFVESLQKFGGSSNRLQRNYFLQCLKLQLNTLSRENISGMKHKYQSKRKALSELQAGGQSKNDDIKNQSKNMLMRELEVLQESIINSSIGLEHFFRELGQMYEAALESQRYRGELAMLPKAVAELMIEGYPLELMDGDAAHVPLKWVTAVLSEAVTMLEDPNVFVLSTLGLQSTGKSTLLNTIFGLQFNVSAGRCTRGAFMQLLPLDRELKHKTMCSYLLIVDTEGLRAPELDPLKTQKHDNELATFVIGLANMTLINIYGEVPGDMDDILQTSVHAFLRMNQIKFHPSCQFVHQNAGVNIQGEVGRAKFTQKLNEFTLNAAREEKCEGQYECFNDVIEFNDQTDVHYFPGLWKGDPPMAPVNQGYSIAAQKLKEHVIDIMCKRVENSILPGTVGDLSLSSFQIKINDLWDALLKEKFVFSFKNTLEITAYNSLEAVYSDWDWKFKDAMLKWEIKAENEIKSEPIETVSSLVEKKLMDLKKYVYEDLYEPLASKMKDFFNCHKQSEILVQWKAKFELKLKSLSQDLISHAEEHCKNLLSSKQAFSQFKEESKRDKEFITTELQNIIESMKKEKEKLKKSLEDKYLNPEQLKKLLERNLFSDIKIASYKEQEVITEFQEEQITAAIQQSGGKMTEDCLKNILVGGDILSADEVQEILKQGELTEEELRKKFDKCWIKLINKLPSLPSSNPLSVAARVEKTLSEHAKTYEGSLISKLNKTKLRDWGTTLELKVKEVVHFNKKTNILKRIKNNVVRMMYGTVDPCEIEAIEITQRVLHCAAQHIQEKTKVNTDFRQTFTQELLRLVDKKINDESVTVKERFTFTHEYRLDMYLTVCGYALPKFERMAESFREQTDPRLQLEKREKVLLFTKFKNQYYQMKQEEAIAETLCTYLKGLVEVQVRKTLGLVLVNNMRDSAHYFSNKRALKVKILTDCLEYNKFDEYMKYVKKVGKYLEERLKDYTIKYCEEEVCDKSTRLQVSAKDRVTHFIGVIENAVTYNTADANKWLEVFCADKTLRSELAFDLKVIDLTNSNDSKELNLENFKSNIRSGLLKLKEILLASFDGVTCESEMPNKPHEHELLSTLVGCTKQCPFCGEQCDLQSSHEGKCRTEVHRLKCLAGWRYRETQIMMTDICPALIASDRQFYKSSDSDILVRYDKYDEVYPDWSITPDVNPPGSKYWMKFVAEYKDSLAKYFHAKPPAVPPQWIEMEKEEIERDLKDLYKL